jgi:hypothetical protein
MTFFSVLFLAAIVAVALGFWLGLGWVWLQLPRRPRWVVGILLWGVLLPGCVYSCGYGLGLWTHVSKGQARYELGELLGFELPQPFAIENAWDGGAAIGRDWHHGYDLVFEPHVLPKLRSEWFAMTSPATIDTSWIGGYSGFSADSLCFGRVPDYFADISACMDWDAGRLTYTARYE